MLTRLTRTKLGIDACPLGPFSIGPGGSEAGHVPEPVGEPDRLGLDQLDGPGEILIVFERRNGGDLGGGGDRPGLLPTS